MYLHGCGEWTVFIVLFQSYQPLNVLHSTSRCQPFTHIYIYALVFILHTIHTLLAERFGVQYLAQDILECRLEVVGIELPFFFFRLQSHSRPPPVQTETALKTGYQMSS